MKSIKVVVSIVLIILLCLCFVGCKQEEELGAEIKIDLQTMKNSCFVEYNGDCYRVFSDGIYRAGTASKDFSRIIEGSFLNISANDRYIFAIRAMNLEKGPEWTYGNLVRFDLSTMNETLIAENVGSYMFVGDKIVYQYSPNWMMVKETPRLGKHNGALYRINISGNNKKVVVDSISASNNQVVSFWEYNGLLYYTLRSKLNNGTGQAVYRYDIATCKAAYIGESVCWQFCATYENYALGVDYDKLVFWDCISCTEKVVDSSLPDSEYRYYAFSKELSDLFEPELVAFSGDDCVIVTVPDGYYPADSEDAAAKNYLGAMTKRPYLMNGTIEWFGW